MSSKIIPAIAENWLKISLVVVVLLGFAAAEAFAQTSQPTTASAPATLSHEQLVKRAAKEPLIKEEYKAGGKPLTEEQLAEVAAANKLIDSAVQARSEGKYAEAAEACDKALATYQQVLGKDYHRTITAALLSRTLAAFKSATPEDQKKLAESDKLEQKAKTAHEAGDYRGALKAEQEALQIREDILGKDHAENSTLLRMIGNEQTELGQLRDAEQSLNAALEVATNSYGSQHPETGLVLDRLGWLKINQGKAEDAVQSLSRAVRIFRATVGEGGELAESLDNLGTALIGIRDADRALMSKLRAYVIRERILGPDARDTAVSLSNLAWLYTQLGRVEPKEILDLRKRALAIFEKVLGPEHAWTFLETANVARQYLAVGEAEEGIKLFEKMVQSDQAHPDRLDQRAVDRLINLGTLYLSNGRFEDGRRFLARAAESNQALYEKGDVDAAISLQDGLTNAYTGWRLFEAAAQAGEQAMAWAQKRGAPADETALARLQRLGSIYKDLGKSEQAKRVLHDALRQANEIASKEPLRPVGIQLLLTMVYLQLGQLDEAERTCDQALRLTEANMPRKSRAQVYPLVLMGRVQAMQKQYELASFSLEEALAIMEKEENRRSDPAAYMSALEELAACRLAQGETKQAVELCQRAVSQGRELGDLGRNVNAKAMLVDALKKLTDALKVGLPASQKEYESAREDLKKSLLELRDLQALTAEHKQWLKEVESAAG